MSKTETPKMTFTDLVFRVPSVRCGDCITRDQHNRP